MLALPRHVYAQRRSKILGLLEGGAAILLPTHGEAIRSNTTTFPFRPASDFWYLSGFGEPDAWLLLKKEGVDPGFHLFVAPSDPQQEVWTGRRAGIEGAKAEFGADHAHPLPELAKTLGSLLEDVDTLYFPFGQVGDKETRLHEILRGVRVGRKAGLGPSTLVDASAFMAGQRLRKTDEELQLMREGARITGEAHVAAMQQVRPGMYEYEIQALLEYTFRRQGAWGWAYGTIVAGGDNANILHYVHNDAQFAAGELMLVDAGAEIEGYATDVTRTSPVDGKYSPAARDVYAAVLRVQKKAIEAVRPGASINGIHTEVLRNLTEELVGLGLLSGDVETLVDNEAYKPYYMHRTSHWLGLDVHDVGRYVQRDGEDVPFEPGMVLTVEPGLYLSAADETVPEAMRGIGIRIEDDVLVTADGHEVLTAHIPKEIDDVEALRR
jgi:Xaa-Pro aminopeptidase